MKSLVLIFSLLIKWIVIALISFSGAVVIIGLSVIAWTYIQHTRK